MKRSLLAALAGLAACVISLGSSQAGTAKTEPHCQPYSVVNKSSIIPCPAGYSGVQYTMNTKACPSGVVTTSTAFVTTGCTAAGGNATPQRGTKAVVRCQGDANVSCLGKPDAVGCPAGMEWSLAGTGVAHCVISDYACGWGKSQTHDFLGNAGCAANTCPSNQVLQGDGISCACPAGLSVWNGTECIAPVITCVAGNSANAAVACGSGFTGSKFTYTVTSCPTGSYGTPSYSTSGYDTSGCGCANGGSDYPSCTPPCSISTSDEEGACKSGYNGTAYRTKSVNSCNGAPTYSKWDYSGCSKCTSSSTQESRTCTAPTSGTAYRTKTVDSCSGISYSEWDTSSCSCASSTAQQRGSCQAGYSGSAYRDKTTDCRGNITYGAWDYSSCSAPPVCTETQSTVSVACSPTNYEGSGTRIKTVNSCTGTSFSQPDYSNCKPPPKKCTESQTTENVQCSPSNYTGNGTRIKTVNSCTGTSYSAPDYSNCSAPCEVTQTTENVQCVPSNYEGNGTRTKSVNSCGNKVSYSNAEYSGCTPPKPACVPVAQVRYTGRCSTGRTGFPNQDFLSEGLSCPGGVPVVLPKKTVSPCYHS